MIPDKKSVVLNYKLNNNTLKPNQMILVKIGKAKHGIANQLGLWCNNVSLFWRINVKLFSLNKISLFRRSKVRLFRRSFQRNIIEFDGMVLFEICNLKLKLLTNGVLQHKLVACRAYC